MEQTLPLGADIPAQHNVLWLSVSNPFPRISGDTNLTRVKSVVMDKITGKNIAITGAARGIGYATATALLRRGARVVIGDRDVEALGSAVEGLKEEGNVDAHPLDVTDPASFKRFLEAASAGGPIDVLVNNAGVMPIGPFLSTSDRAIRSMVEVNLYGVINGCQLALPEMVARRRGQVVNIASVAGLMAVPGMAVYNASKFGVVGLSRALSDEFAPQGVQVSAVLPTFTNTELIAGTDSTGAQKPVEPEDIAAAGCASSRSPASRSPCPSRSAPSRPSSIRFPPGSAGS
ncbi:Putative short chain dehydrogenase/reductase [Mycobacteroides abscessus]|nr:Putative short chain dehydrogenase/reductase [Mycobacteroides abscessus]